MYEIGAFAQVDVLRNALMQETTDVLLPSNFSTLSKNQEGLKIFFKRVNILKIDN